MNILPDRVVFARGEKLAGMPILAYFIHWVQRRIEQGYRLREQLDLNVGAVKDCRADRVQIGRAHV